MTLSADSTTLEMQGWAAVYGMWESPKRNSDWLTITSFLPISHQYVIRVSMYLYSSFQIIHLNEKETIFWLWCLHELKIDYLIHIAVQMLQNIVTINEWCQHRALFVTIVYEFCFVLFVVVLVGSSIFSSITALLWLRNLYSKVTLVLPLLCPFA